MTTLRNTIFGAGVAVALSVAATAAMAETANVTTSATIIRPITIGTVTPLAFGSAAPGSTQGTIVVTTSNTRSATGGVALVGGTGATSGGVVINGQDAQAFNIAYTPSITSVPSGNVVGDYSLSGITTDGCGVTGGTGNIASAQIAASATSCTIKLGATLGVPANAAAGAVAGNIQAVINYN
ncbi:DUF4402 domain-containing protein [Phenylobacterium sp.]|jgi:hypothetical protein|uniref:DUF4402 domain-containing protein n=1 Tax=Phenylobacterium sp. TaxID=1871053 RepID=UPI0037846902